MLSAYFDEAGTHGADQPLGVAGVVYDARSRRTLHQRWKKELERAGIDYFHAVDFPRQRGQCAKMTPEKADFFYRRFVGLARKYARSSVVVCSVPQLFDPGHWPYPRYVICALVCMTLVLREARRDGGGGMPFFIETGAQGKGQLETAIKALRKKEYWAGFVTYQFGVKEDVPVLQTADLFAYEAMKRVRDMGPAGEARPVRKSLSALIEKNGSHGLLVLDQKLFTNMVNILTPIIPPKPPRTSNTGRRRAAAGTPGSPTQPGQDAPA
jgi:hypothetical protein